MKQTNQIQVKTNETGFQIAKLAAFFLNSMYNKMYHEKKSLLFLKFAPHYGNRYTMLELMFLTYLSLSRILCIPYY